MELQLSEKFRKIGYEIQQVIKDVGKHRRRLSDIDQSVIKDYATSNSSHPQCSDITKQDNQVGDDISVSKNRTCNNKACDSLGNNNVVKLGGNAVRLSKNNVANKEPVYDRYVIYGSPRGLANGTETMDSEQKHNSTHNETFHAPRGETQRSRSPYIIQTSRSSEFDSSFHRNNEPTEYLVTPSTTITDRSEELSVPDSQHGQALFIRLSRPKSPSPRIRFLTTETPRQRSERPRSVDARSSEVRIRSPRLNESIENIATSSTARPRSCSNIQNPKRGIVNNELPQSAQIDSNSLHSNSEVSQRYPSSPRSPRSPRINRGEHLRRCSLLSTSIPELPFTTSRNESPRRGSLTMCSPERPGTTIRNVSPRRNSLTMCSPERPGTTSCNGSPRRNSLTTCSPERPGKTSCNGSPRRNSLAICIPERPGTTSRNVSPRRNSLAICSPERPGTTSRNVSPRRNSLSICSPERPGTTTNPKTVRRDRSLSASSPSRELTIERRHSPRSPMLNRRQVSPNIPFNSSPQRGLSFSSNYNNTQRSSDSPILNHRSYVPSFSINLAADDDTDDLEDQDALPLPTIVVTDWDTCTNQQLTESKNSKQHGERSGSHTARRDSICGKMTDVVESSAHYQAMFLERRRGSFGEELVNPKELDINNLVFRW